MRKVWALVLVLALLPTGLVGCTAASGRALGEPGEENTRSGQLSYSVPG